MALKRFGSASSVEDSYQLPWLEEYIKRSGDKEAILPITFVTFSDSGAMVFTDQYKAHIKAARSAFKDLQEALPAYADYAKPVPMLFCSADKNKRPVILQDDEKRCHRWHHSEGRYVQYGEGKQVPSESQRKNPLLACLEDETSSAALASASGSDGTSSETVKVKAGKTK